MRYHIAHSVRGGLRLRGPSPWLRPRQGAVERRRRALTGVRAVAGNTLTGSLRIDYDPFSLAEQSLVDELKHLDAHLTGPPPARRRGAQPSAVVGTKTPLLNVNGATTPLPDACTPHHPHTHALLSHPARHPLPPPTSHALNRLPRTFH